MVDGKDAVEQRINYRFRQVKHLERALTHSSWANEQGSQGEDNERLEFLGDAVLDLVISREALDRYPGAPEGRLTRLRSDLVKERTLADLGRSLGLDRHVLLGRGEEAQGGRERDSLLADAFEAVVGAVFLDGGYEAARDAVLGLYEPLWPDDDAVPAGKDHKSRLQELTQKRFGERPVYVLVESTGPEHEKVFVVEAALPDGSRHKAAGPSVKKAEQAAAAAAVEALTSGP